MEEKLQQVTLWLEKIFGDQPIPEYEVNPRTVDILYELVEYNEARDREVSLMIEDMKQAAAEYEAKANYLQDILTEGLGLSPSSLSSEGTRSLDVLVNSAMILETKDTSLASLFAAINDMNSELYATESKNGEMELELSKIGKKLTAALMLEERLKEDLKNTEELLEVEEAEADRQTQNVKFLKDKSEDLKIRIKAAEEQLLATGLNQSLTHDSLMNLSEKLGELQKEIASLKKKLEPYLDLPPDPSLAKVKIEEVKRELNALEEELSKEINKVTLETPRPSKPKFT